MIVLYQNHEICKKGEPITAEQAKILKLFDYKLSEFKVNLVSQWDKENGYVTSNQSIFQLRCTDREDCFLLARKPGTTFTLYY
ncbi:hypothetical protein KIN20_026731 [Parelaphostrongylus tenuis]|uniref:Uncharacterized protein n=1 Tax=Parelaphostrongylus tenuis TaxID=148309 RepID=A0AAD5QYK0_PARTN|nr:hypothetical protein KIN20_026731 [Parelaphostrongylus tenuis]